MCALKTSYELGLERIIVNKENKRIDNDSEKIDMDFISIPEFDDRADKTIESVGSTEDIEKDKIPPCPIRIQKAETFYCVDKIPEICWNGNFMDYTGFSRMNRAFVFGLSNRNIKVKIESESSSIRINKATQDELAILANNEISPTAPKIFSATVPISYINHPGKKILYTMIETSETIHKDYRDRLNLFDEIWVPTKYGKRILENNGVHPRILVMPLGVDTKRYGPNTGYMDFGSLRKFKFLSVFRWSYRKGIDILLRSYMEEFSGEEDVSLLLVSRAIETPGNEKGMKVMVEDFNNIKQDVNKPEEDLPHVALYSKNIPEKDMPKVYGSADAFVLISRGEGFGLIYLEAGATGIPVIASNCSGQTDFLTRENSYLVEPDGYVKAEVNGKLARMAKLCRFYEGQTFPDFGEKSIEQTRKYLREVYENYKEAKDKAARLRKLIINNYTWDMAVDKVYNRIREIGDSHE
jgi:glycosyltransferase involved in cell wall biosynthesis